MSNEKRLKIAYLCETDPIHKWAHSGGNHLIFNALQKHVGDVTYIENHWGALEFLQKLINKLPLNISLRLRFRIHTLLSRFIAKKVAKELRKDKYDVLYCAYSFFCLANLKLPYPMLTVFSSDATYTAYKFSVVGSAFESYFTPSRMLDPYLLKTEKKVYGSTDLILWPSAWIKDAADKLYNLNESQSRMLHWGANISPPAREELQLNNPVDGPIRLLLVGRDWVPKGGPIVYEVLKSLLAKGIDAHLTVVGCEPPDSQKHEKMTVHPYLNKTIPEQLALFKELYRSAHFFVMPSYEAYGFAFCEAGAYGLPVLCLRVGGVPISEGQNGHALPDGSTADDFSDRILGYINNPESYQRFRESSRAYYEEHLNWDAWGQKASQLIEQKLDEKFHS